MSTTYNFVPGPPAYDLEYQHVRLGEYVERDDGIVGIIVKSADSSWRVFVPLAWTDCLRGHMYATRDGTPFLKLGGWFVDLKTMEMTMEMTMGQGLRFREVAGTIEVQL